MARKLFVSLFDLMTKWNGWLDISCGVSDKAELTHFWALTSESTSWEISVLPSQETHSSELFAQVLMRKLSDMYTSNFFWLFIYDGAQKVFIRNS